jgi:hypothetical protein
VVTPREQAAGEEFSVWLAETYGLEAEGSPFGRCDWDDSNSSEQGYCSAMIATPDDPRDAVILTATVYDDGSGGIVFRPTATMSTTSLTRA